MIPRESPPPLFAQPAPRFDVAATRRALGVRDPKLPLARATDPLTSHLAAARAVASGSVGTNMRRVVEGLRERPGSTSKELAGAIGLDRHETSRRLSDAAHAGLIRKGEARICSVAGSLCVTWYVLTPSGRSE